MIRINERIVSLVAVASLFLAATTSQHAEQSAEILAVDFSFRELALPSPPHSGPNASQRRTHPAVARLSSWISAVGASVAVTDLDLDGVANDICYVETATDRVVVTPAPQGHTLTPILRYESFELDASPTRRPDGVAPMGCLPGDYNEDGWIDLLVYYWGRQPVVWLRRAGETETVARDSFLEQEFEINRGSNIEQEWYTNAAIQADVDGDGHVDLVFGNYFQDGVELLGTPSSSDPAKRPQMQDSMSRAFNGGHNRLFRWVNAEAGRQPSVHFKKVKDAFASKVATAWTLAIGAADLDGDLLPELYFANDFGPDRLLHNRSTPGKIDLRIVEGVRDLTTPASKVLGRDSFKGMGVDFGDLNGDGHFDFFISNIAQSYALEESHLLFESTGRLESFAKGRAPYRDRSEALGLSRSGWGWDTRLEDFNNDGTLEAVQATGFLRGETNRWPELHELAMGNDLLLKHPEFWFRCQAGDDLSGTAVNPFFVRSTGGRFVDVAPQVGLGRDQISRAIATADVDADGDIDLLVGNQWDESFLYLNESRSTRPSLVLSVLYPLEPIEATRLVGTSTTSAGLPLGSPAYGARVEIKTDSGITGVRQVDGGSGHSGVRSHEVHFGLGALQASEAVAVRILWRDGLEVRQHDIALAPGRHTLLLKRQGI